MPSEVMNHWLASGRTAQVGPHDLRPAEHPCAKGKPLSSQKGQAEAFFLTGAGGQRWILKKFHQTCTLDRAYLAGVGTVLPKEAAFACGTARQILATGALNRVQGHYYSQDLDQWLDGTILMPRVKGIDWATLADSVRDGEVILEPPQRLNICLNLTKLVELLEAHQCSHRDLSCGNIFVECRADRVHLIDFDSLFHPSLKMPNATTCGTEGYTAPYAWANGGLDPGRTWCERADRYALTLLNAEILLVNRGAAATGEGGIFRQEELKNRSGRGIDSVVTELNARYPQAAAFLQQAIQSRTAADCPSPKQWHTFCRTAPDAMAATTLAELPDPADRIAYLLTRSRPAAPLWHIPNLKDVPATIPVLPVTSHTTMPHPELPSDPWACGADIGRLKGGQP